LTSNGSILSLRRVIICTKNELVKVTGTYNNIHNKITWNMFFLVFYCFIITLYLPFVANKLKRVHNVQ